MSRQHNCMHCNHYKRHWGRSAPDGFVLLTQDTESCLGNQYGMCEADRNDEMKTWWDANKDKPVDDVSDMPCYEGTEFANALDGVIDTLDHIISKRENNEEHR